MISKVQLVKTAIDNHPTVRYLQRKLNMENFQYNKLSQCDDEGDERNERQPQQVRRIRAKNVKFSRRCFSYSSIPWDENSKPFAASTKSAVKTTTRPDQQLTTVPKPAQQAQQRTEATVQSSGSFQSCSKRPCEENSNGFALTATAREQGGQRNLAIVHRPLCQAPSWHDNQVAQGKLGERRSAVCDNIERQLLNSNGISLRKLRKFLVMDNILHEVNLL